MFGNGALKQFSIYLTPICYSSFYCCLDTICAGFHTLALFIYIMYLYVLITNLHYIRLALTVCSIGYSMEFTTLQHCWDFVFIKAILRRPPLDHFAYSYRFDRPSLHVVVAPARAVAILHVLLRPGLVAIVVRHRPVSRCPAETL